MKLLRLIFILFVSLAFIYGAEDQKSRFPVLKSALLPGWGEHDLGFKQKGLLFNGVEAGLWILVGLATTTANAHEADLYYFAAEYGHISNPQSKGDIFMDRVSKYDNMDAYNEQMLRNRQWDRIYSAAEGNYWNWESDAKRNEFFEIKTQRYLWRQRVTYTFGAITLNHLVSALDALYLSRQSMSISVKPEFGDRANGLRLSVSF